MFKGHNGVHAEPVWNPNDTPAATIREQTENTPHMLHGSSNNSDGYMVAKPRPVSQERDSTSYYHIGNSAAANGTAGPRTYDADYNARTNANREAISKVNRYNVGNQSLAAYDQNVTNLRNRATKPSEMRANMPKVSATMQTHGQMSGKHTRERAVDCQRNNPGMVSALNSNPYAQSLQSWA